jgi:hypothetical protein
MGDAGVSFGVQLRRGAMDGPSRIEIFIAPSAYHSPAAMPFSLPPKYVLTRVLRSLTKGRMPLVYVFAASKMEAQPAKGLSTAMGASP